MPVSPTGELIDEKGNPIGGKIDVSTGQFIEKPPTAITSATTTPTPTPIPSPGVINGSTLTNLGSYNFPTIPTDPYNYSGMIAGGKALSDFYKSLSPDTEKPTDLTSLYNTLYGQSGIDIAQTTTLASKKKLDLLNAEMAALSAEAQATPIKIQEEFAGRAGVQQQKLMSEAELRKIALRSLPLQGQILAQQAIANNDQQALEFAKDKFSMAFGIQMKQAEMDYNYKKDLRDKAWNFFTDAQKDKAAKQQKEDDKTFQLLQNNLNYAQTLSSKAIDSGQGDIAAKITQLDPKSATYQQDLATWAGKITPKVTTAGQSDFEQAFFRDKGRLPTVNELLDFKAKEAAAGRKPEDTVFGDGKTGFTDIMQQVIDADGTPEQAAREAAIASENIGIQVDQKTLNKWIEQARKLKKTVLLPPPEQADTSSGFLRTNANTIQELISPVKSFFSNLFGG